MKKILTLTAALMVIGASASLASGLIANWNDCATGGVVKDQAFACDRNLGNVQLYLSAVVPADMPMFAATSAIVDVQVSDAVLPDWWLTNSGQCRANAISMSFDPSVLAGGFNCWNIWHDNPNLSVFAIQQGLHGPNTVRLNGGAAIPAGSEYDVPADGSELIIAKVTINFSKTINTGACAGCTSGACLVFNEAKMQQPAGVGDYTVTNEDSPGSAYVTWQGGIAECPIPTPAKNRTWGAVKNLYR